MTRGTPASRLLAVCLLAVALAIAYAVIGSPLRAAYEDTLTRIGDQRRAIDQLRGTTARETALATALKSNADGPDDFLVAAATDSSAAALLQSRLQALIEENSAQLVSLEALDGESQGPFRAIRVRAQFATGHNGLQRILHALEDGRPVVFLDNLTVNARTARAFGVERPLDVRVDLTSFRAENE